jgi:hypothetical protein
MTISSSLDITITVTPLFPTIRTRLEVMPMSLLDILMDTIMATVMDMVTVMVTIIEMLMLQNLTLPKWKQSLTKK